MEAAEQRSHWGSKNCWVSSQNRTFWNIVTEPISSAQSSPGRLNMWTTGPNALVLLMPQAPRGGLPVFGASKELQRCQTWGLDVRGTVKSPSQTVSDWNRSKKALWYCQTPDSCNLNIHALLFRTIISNCYTSHAGINSNRWSDSQVLRWFRLAPAPVWGWSRVAWLRPSPVGDVRCSNVCSWWDFVFWVLCRVSRNTQHWRHLGPRDWRRYASICLLPQNLRRLT